MIVNANIVRSEFLEAAPSHNFSLTDPARSRDATGDFNSMALFQTIGELSEHLDGGHMSAVELCSELLDAAQTSPFGAFSDILTDVALAEAASSDARRKVGQALGPLDGIPIAIKDIIDTHPAVCKAGLQHLSSYRPTTDAVVVQRLRRAGAVVLGVTETDPGAFSTETPQVRNPLAPDRTAGGSSGGSAAAVAAGLAVVAIGTDTGGSIRIPAACCSIYGFKPTWGRVDTTGVRPLARSLDHVGPLSRNISDLRILQGIIDPGARCSQAEPEVRALRLATCESYYADASGLVRNTMSAIMRRLTEAGATIDSVSLPHPDEVLALHMINLPREAAAYHGEHFSSEWRSYPEIARATIIHGNSISAKDYEKAEQRRDISRLAVDAAVEGVDALVLPTMPIDAPLRSARLIEIGGSTVTKLEATIRYTVLFNQSGHPVISMPAALLPDGRALSIQLIGRRGGDDLLFGLARRIEKILSLHVDYARIIAAQPARVYPSNIAIS